MAGPTGSGKNGLDKPNSGQARLYGKQITNLDEQERFELCVGLLKPILRRVVRES